jgi:hypothetical protein
VKPWAAIGASLLRGRRGDARGGGRHLSEELQRAIHDEFGCFLSDEVPDPRNQLNSHVIDMSVNAAQVMRAQDTVVSAKEQQRQPRVKAEARATPTH